MSGEVGDVEAVKMEIADGAGVVGEAGKKPRPELKYSASTQHVLETIHEEEEALAKKIKHSFMASRRLQLFVFFVATIMSGIIIGLVSAVIYASKDTQISTSGVLTTKDGKSAVITASGYTINDIDSESPLEEISQLNRVFISFGEAKNQTRHMFIPTGFSQLPCLIKGCLSKHILHVYTSEGVIVYHGKVSSLILTAISVSPLSNVDYPRYLTLIIPVI